MTMPDKDQDWADIYFDPARIASRAHFATEHGPVARWFRQTPGGDGVFGRTLFSEAPTGDAAEWLVVCDEPPAGFRTRIPAARRILFIGEPPSVKVYPAAYLNLFGTVVAPIDLPGYRGRHVRQQPCLPWHYGRDRPHSWRELAAGKRKSQLLSVFCSAKLMTQQQALRLRFAGELKKRFGSRVDHFGHGFNGIDEKADGLAPYRFTIVLENNLEAGFWTEKLADAYLGDCFPIYAGGRIGAADFDTAARLDIDVARIDESLLAIERLLETADHDRLRPLLAAQRRRVMLEHNLFAVAARLIAQGQARPGLLWRRSPMPRSWDMRSSQR